jgi:hypothetical protein
MSQQLSLARDAVESWEDAVEHILAYEEPEEVDNALVTRSIVSEEFLAGRLAPPLLRILEAADREFIRIRPTLVERFPGEFNPKYWHATEDEWWWWPDRLPAELAQTPH